MKTRLDPDIEYFTLGCVDVYHEGPDWPGADRRHLLQATLFYQSFQGAYGACIITVGILEAQQIILFARANPDVIQDACLVCRAGYNGPHRPRWNAHRGEEPAILVPCYIEDWL